MNLFEKEMQIKNEENASRVATNRVAPPRRLALALLSLFLIVLWLSLIVSIVLTIYGTLTAEAAVGLAVTSLCLIASPAIPACLSLVPRSLG